MKLSFNKKIQSILFIISLLMSSVVFIAAALKLIVRKQILKMRVPLKVKICYFQTFLLKKSKNLVVCI